MIAVRQEPRAQDSSPKTAKTPWQLTYAFSGNMHTLAQSADKIMFALKYKSHLMRENEHDI